LCTKKDTFSTSSWAPLDLEKAINTNCFLSILLLRKDDILKRFRGPPEFPEIDKGLPVKDVEQKLMISVFFRGGPKGSILLPVKDREQKSSFLGGFGTSGRPSPAEGGGMGPPLY
jgi:hypothetical protein